MADAHRHGIALASALLVLLGSCGHHRDRGRAPEAAAPPLPLAIDRERADYLSLLTRGRTVADSEWQGWLEAGTPVADIVDALLADPFVYDTVAPNLLLKNNGLYLPGEAGGFPLERGSIAGREVYYFEACAPEEVIEVAPWWDLRAKVAVCSAAVHPEVWIGLTDDGAPMGCDSMLSNTPAKGQKACGCGPNLLRCTTPEIQVQIQHSALAELRATAAAVAGSDRPLADLFEMNETVRDPLMELYQRRDAAENRRLSDPAAWLASVRQWPAQGKLARRDEVEAGQHAGILTAPAIKNRIADPRQRSRIMFEILWCSGESAPGAFPEDVLSLHTPNLSATNQGWQELAQRPICTNCHARLDYGMQFFRGHTTPHTGTWSFSPGRSGGEGPLYGTSIRDMRGVAPLTAAGFARLATSQPEFGRCMARDVAEYVFGPRVSDAVIDELAASAAPRQLRYRSLMRAALLRFATCASCAPPGHEGPSAELAGGEIPSLEELVDDHCSACHYQGARILDLEGPLDPRKRVLVIDHAVFGRMPPTGPLPAEVRQQFLAAGERDGTVSPALRLRAEPLAALPLPVARADIRSRTGAGPLPKLNAVETSLDGRDNLFTPNFVAVTAVDAYRSCPGASQDRAACVRRLLRELWGRSASK